MIETVRRKGEEEEKGRRLTRSSSSSHAPSPIKIRRDDRSNVFLSDPNQSPSTIREINVIDPLLVASEIAFHDHARVVIPFGPIGVHNLWSMRHTEIKEGGREDGKVVVGRRRETDFMLF
jgi:hypothetical protein